MLIVATKKDKNKSKDSTKSVEDVEILPAVEPTDEDLKPEESEVEAIDADALPALDEAEIEPVEVEGKSSKGSIVSYDPLRAYLSEIAHHPKLSKEEEHELAVKYKEKHDLDAAYKLTVSNLWLVVAIARRYQRAARSVLDLIQEGNIGLMEAVKNFDPYRDVRFPSYATWWIKAYIVRFIIANWRLVKIGTTQAQRKLFFNLEKEKEKLERQGFSPTAKLLAANLNVKESEVLEMQQRLGGGDVSVDAPVGENGESNMHGILPSEAPSAEDTMAAEEIRQKLKASMDEFAQGLNEKEKVIYETRLLAEDKATLHEIADQFSISKERVRQIENRVKAKLKSHLSEHLGSGFLFEEMGLSDSEGES